MENSRGPVDFLRIAYQSASECHCLDTSTNAESDFDRANASGAQA
jgi:hypothetical protein